MSGLVEFEGNPAQIRLKAALPYLTPIFVAVLAISFQNPSTLIVLLADGAWPAAIILSAAGWGAWPAKRLASAAENRGQEFFIATAIGLGLIAVTTLAVGMLGFLSRAMALGLVAIGMALGIVCIASKSCKLESCDSNDEIRVFEAHNRIDVLGQIAALLPLAIPVYVAIAGATVPPGVLWRDEAGGYDVLEYHLQVQREYYEAGRITFLPHNVYASFPQQVEVLYLLLMHLVGNPVDAAIPAQLLHGLFGGLAVAAFGAWLPAGWPRICGVTALGCTPWLAYLGCLAYVENGMLFFAAIAFGIFAGWVRGRPTPLVSAGVAGLCAGMAGGCKYTAIVLVAGAGALAAIAFLRKPIVKKCRLLGIYLAAATVALAPWLVRNTIFTGNPVYPFAYSTFGGASWSEEQAIQWGRGHSISGRASTAWNEILFGKFGGLDRTQLFATLFGILPIALVVGPLCLNVRKPKANPNTRVIYFWLTLAVLIGLVWACTTQVAGRLMVPLLIPLAAMLAFTVERHRKTGVSFSLLSSVIGAIIVYGTWSNANRDWQRRFGVSLADMAGQADLFTQNNPYNTVLPDDARLWLVGDAAVFYIQRPMRYFTTFNRDPWLEFSRDRDPQAAVEWLRERGITHVILNWGEIERLRRTYGFSDRATKTWVAELEQAGLNRFPVPSEWAASLNSIDIYSLTSKQ